MRRIESKLNTKQKPANSNARAHMQIVDAGTRMEIVQRFLLPNVDNLFKLNRLILSKTFLPHFPQMEIYVHRHTQGTVSAVVVALELNDDNGDNNNK